MRKFIVLLILLAIIITVVHVVIKGTRTTKPNEVTFASVGEALGTLFINSWKSPNDITKLRDDFSITATNTEIYLCLSSLYFVAFIRATQSENIQIPSPIIEQISHSMASFLVAEFIVLHHVDENIDVLLQKQNRITQELIEIWDESLDKTPSPHWYVGKELCYILNGRDESPSPPLVTVFAGFLSDDTILIKGFLDDLEKNFAIVE